MRDIDLIPAEYRQARWLSLWLKQLGISAVVLIAFCLVLYVGVSRQVESLQAEATVLEQQQAITAQQRTALEDLHLRKTLAGKQLKLLNGLRSGAPARSVFNVIDRALADSDVWFLNWQFRRAGMTVPESVAGTETGYFIMVDEDAAANSSNTWQVETHMTITGQALDHEALSQFVNGLYAQNSVVDVKVQRTELNKRNRRDVVQFDLAVVLKSEAKG